MGRKSRSIGKGIVTHYGMDHAIGEFIDLTSKEYADSGKDLQGEGYFFEYSKLFGITTNRANLTLEEVKGETPEFWEKIDKFHQSLKEIPKRPQPISHFSVVDAVYAANSYTDEDLSDIAGLQWNSFEDLKQACLERIPKRNHASFIAYFKQNIQDG